MRRARKNTRRHERLGTVLGVAVGRKSGITRDVSASGVFFETDLAYHRGSKIHCEVPVR